MGSLVGGEGVMGDPLPAPHMCPESTTPEALAYSGHGRAIDPPILPYRTDDGAVRWCIGNGEYGSDIHFCPWCGLNLDTVTV